MGNNLVNIFNLIIKEILYRKLNFIIGVLSVVVAIGCLVAELTLLQKHDIHTEQIVALKEAETEMKMKKLNDDYRKLMKKFGFNVFILLKAQNLGDLYAEDYASKYMPEKYVERLVNARIMTVRHLLPILQQKLKWPEKKRTVILIGTRGEVPMLHRIPREPMLNLVPRGTMIMGYELHRSFGVSVGDKVKLLDRNFEIIKCHPERGDKDDITIWINLKEAQELLNKKGKINGILALQCMCAEGQLAEIRKEISRILPDTQVVEFATKVLIRAEVRKRAALAHKQAIEAEKTNRARLRKEKETFAAFLVPLLTAGCIIWVGFLAFDNVHRRRFEIGILKALGLKSIQIVLIFLGKAVLIGFIGACIGYLAGFISIKVFNPLLLFLVLLLAPLLSAIASLIPAVMAARQDPAEILREE